MDKKLKIFFQHRQPINAITWYRIIQPLKILANMDLVEVMEDDFDPLMPRETKADLIDKSDIAFTHAVPASVIFRDYQKMTDMPPRYNGIERVVDYPAPWILDIDDAYDWVSPTNPAFSTWGVRDMAGNLVGDGGKIGAILENGKEVTLYEDGKVIPEGRGFRRLGASYSYRLNIQRIGKLKVAINGVSCVTVTTEALKRHILKADNPKRVEVLPNCMYRKAFVDIKPKKYKRLRILWQGGGSHYDDWAGMRDAMVEVTKRYPNIVWVIFGQDYTPLLRGGGIKDKNLEYHEWVDHAAHKYHLATLGCDINLAIIEPNLFSRGKSCIKWYEASALHYPIATLATDAIPYNTEIQDGVTGLLYKGPDGFVEKLGTLIENPGLRRELAKNAHEWVWENRDAEKWALKMLEMFKDVREKAIKRGGDLREIFGATEGNLVPGSQLEAAEEEVTI